MKLLVLFISMVCLSFPLGLQAAQFQAGVTKTDVPMFAGTSAPNKFKVVGKVVVRGKSREEVRKKINDLSLVNQSDAVVKFQVQLQINPGDNANDLGTALQMNEGRFLGSGILVKYSKDGDFQIKDDAVIPVLN